MTVTSDCTATSDFPSDCFAQASGLCVAFSLKDPNIYLAGTEDGHIHKCSCSYNEQHLDNFFGHAGPVYKLRW